MCFYMCKEIGLIAGREKKTKGGSCLELTVCSELSPSCGLPPKDLKFTASSEERDKSKECTLSLQETAHYGLRLREFHTSRGYSVLGSTLTQPWGEINTPAGPRKYVWVHVCVRTLAYMRACARVCVCTHSCVSSMTHIPIFLLLRKLVDPSMCWYLEGVLLQAQLLWPETKCHWLSQSRPNQLRLPLSYSCSTACITLSSFNKFTVVVDHCFSDFMLPKKQLKCAQLLWSKTKNTIWI